MVSLGKRAPRALASLVVQRTNGGLRSRGCVTITPDETHTNMAGVVRSSMCTYTKPTPTLVSGTGLVDEEVIPDVAPAVTVHVEILDLSQRLASRTRRIVCGEPGPRTPGCRPETRGACAPSGARNNIDHGSPHPKNALATAAIPATTADTADTGSAYLHASKARIRLSWSSSFCRDTSCCVMEVDSCPESCRSSP